MNYSYLCNYYSSHPVINIHNPDELFMNIPLLFISSDN